MNMAGTTLMESEELTSPSPDLAQESAAPLPDWLDALAAGQRDAVVLLEGASSDPADLRVAYANPAFARMLGETPADAFLSLETLLQAHVPAPEVREQMQAALQAGQRFDMETVCLRADGAEFAARLTLAPAPSTLSPDDVSRWLLLVQDSALAEGSRDAQSLLDLVQGVNAIVWEADAASPQFSFVSLRAEMLLGYPLARWREEPDFWAGILHPDDRAQTVAQSQMMAAAGEDYEQEYKLVAADGRVVWVQDTVRIGRDAQGHVRRLRGLILDITARKEAEAQTRLQSHLLDAVPLAAVAADREGRILYWNHPAEELYGGLASEVLGRSLPDVLLPPEARAEMSASFSRLEPGEAWSQQVTLRRRDDALFPAALTVAPLLDDAGASIGVFCVLEDITERRRVERQLEESEQRYKSLFEQNVDAVYSFDLEGRFASANAACETLTGYAPADLIGRSFIPLIAPEDLERALQTYLRALQGEPQHDEISLLHKDGRRIQVNLTKVPIKIGGRLVGIYGIAKDVTERRALEAERERLLHEATDRADRDPLTGLLNQRAFHKRLEQEADRARRDGTPLAVAVMDMDNFKFFNDAYGHTVGDDVLRQVASALQGCCRSYDTLARFGGDEFALLMPSVTPEEVPLLASRIKFCLDAVSFHPPGFSAPIPLSLSVGIAVFPDDSVERMDVLQAADLRLRRAKSSNAGRKSQAEAARLLPPPAQEGFAMLEAMVTAVDNKDRYTRKHSEDVSRLCLQIARQMGLNDDTQSTLRVAALLHDVGKIGVPDAILRKPGKLSGAEVKAIQQHPMMGAVIVGAVPGFEETLDAVRHHHERWDGEGYPFGLRGDETPLLARIMAVADAYSAMTTDRPYRKSITAEDALAVLQGGAGAQWDAECVAAFAQSRRASSGS